MEHRELKHRLYEQLGRVARALDSPQRLEILDLLAQGERSVEDLAREADLSVANTSRHLQVLRGARLVEARKEGLRVFYRPADPEVLAAARGIRTLAERRLAEIDRLVKGALETRDDLEAVPRQELLRRMREGSAVVVDVRPREEYRAGHIAGALSIPVEELPRQLRRIPARKEVVAYCRGPYCLFAYDAVSTLRRHGRRARRLVDGFPEWRAAGLPVAAGEDGEGGRR